MSYNFALESFAKILSVFEMQVLNQKGTNSGIWYFQNYFNFFMET
jgi:hypothetical protein